MRKYIIFIKDNRSEAIPKENITRCLIREMKEKGLRKHHIEIEAENEKNAIIKLNKNSDNYLRALEDFSGNALICAVVVIIISLVYFLN